MPQLDFGPYVAEWHWLITVFGISFFIFNKYFLPQIYVVLKMRQWKTEDLMDPPRWVKLRRRYSYLNQLFIVTRYFYKEVVVEQRHFLRFMRKGTLFRYLAAFSKFKKIYKVMFNFFTLKLNLVVLKLINTLND